MARQTYEFLVSSPLSHCATRLKRNLEDLDSALIEFEDACPLRGFTQLVEWRFVFNFSESSILDDSLLKLELWHLDRVFFVNRNNEIESF